MGVAGDLHIFKWFGKRKTFVKVYGNVEGAIIGANRVIVGPTGRCQNNIIADYLDVAGEVFGDVDVKELVIRKVGRIHGKAVYKTISLLEGATGY